MSTQLKSEPLNPTLYQALKNEYGSVGIVSPGKAISWRLVKSVVSNSRGAIRETRQVIHGGEEYVLRCPVCHDHRARLYVNHRFGVFDPKTGTYNTWLAQCFNEQCYHDLAAQEALFKKVYDPQLRNGRRDDMPKIQILEGTANDPDELAEGKPPGPTIRLDRLRKKRPDHPAIRYLEDRGFDTDWLARVWDVSYCPRSSMPFADNRIIVPVCVNKILLGWQARYIGDNVDGVSFNKAKVPKYWTMPGFKKSYHPYNFERAVTHSTVVVVEGPSDVWNQGRMAMGLFGKSMNPVVVRKLVRAMKKHGPEAAVVVMLDPEQDASDRRNNKPHHIEKVERVLYELMQGCVVPVYLPKGYDPGNIDPQWARELMREAASELKLKLSFRKPK